MIDTAPSLSPSLDLEPDPPQPDFSGIPQNTDPPAGMLAVFGKSPWELDQEQHTLAVGEWRAGVAKQLDAAIADPNKYFKDSPLAFGKNRPEAIRLATNDMFLALNSGGVDVPTGGLTRHVMRQRVADELFDGRGADSEETFHAEIIADHTKRQQRAAIFADVAAGAANAAVLGHIKPDTNATAWTALRETLKTRPGYDPARDADFAEAFHQSRKAARQRMEPFAPQLALVWQAMQAGGAGTTSEVLKSGLANPAGFKAIPAMAEEATRTDAGATAFHLYGTLPEDQRADFMTALGLLARTFPKEAQPGFFSNLAKQGGRQVDALGRGAWEAFMANSIASLGAMPLTVANPGTGNLQGMTQPQAEKARAEYMARKNFAADVRRIEQGDFDPMKSAWGKGTPGTVESGLYGIPGALASTAEAAIPFVGWQLSYLSMQGQAYDDLRNQLRTAGMADKDASAFADRWAPVAAVPQAALEKLQAGAWAGKIPGVQKAMDAAGDLIKNRALRLAGKTIIGATGETVVEDVQDGLLYAVQDIGAALEDNVPTVNWKGPGGVFSGLWAQTGSTFISMLPLSIIGAAGGLNREARARAFAEAGSLQRMALGITPDHDTAIATAAAQGPATLTRAVDVALLARDANSDSAKAAVAQLEAEHAAGQSIAEAAQSSGILPMFRVNSDKSIAVIDSGTGEEIGTAATHTDAVRIATADMAIREESQAAVVAHLGGMLEAMQSRAKDGASGHEVAFTYEPFKQTTAADQVAANPESTTRVWKQLGITEAMDANRRDQLLKTSFVHGFSETEFRDGILSTTNRILGTGTITTVFHEDTHGLRRVAMQRGTFTRDEQVAALRAIDAAMGKAGGTLAAKRFLSDKADAEVTEEELDEAFAELMESEVLRTGVVGTQGTDATPGIVSRYFDAAYEASPFARVALSKLRGMARYLRAMYGEVFGRAVAIRRAIDKGHINEGEYHTMLAKLMGVDEVARANSQALITATEIIDGVERLTFADGGTMDMPFSLGRAAGGSFSIGDYRIPHRPNPDGPRAFNLAEDNLMPADVYEHPEWYSAMGKKVIAETMKQLRAVKGKADALLTIYRAGPVGEMNPDDWVSLSKEYARTHAEAQDPEGYKVWQADVPAADVRWAMDDISEFGYFGESVPAVDSGKSFSLGGYYGQNPEISRDGSNGPAFSISREVAPTDYPASAREVLATTSVKSLTSALLKPGENLVPLTPGSAMMVSPAYRAAKKLGDTRAAWDIARHFITPERIAKSYGELQGKALVFVPVTQREGERLNMLPLALAHALQKRLGGRVAQEVLQTEPGGNTGASTGQRGNKEHNFTGTIDRAEGESIVLVDDTFTTGNTLAALYDHLAAQGHQAEHIATFASGRYGKSMAATEEKQQKALAKVGLSAEAFARETGLPIQAYTGAEIQAYLLNGIPGIEGFRARFHADQSGAGSQGSARVLSGADPLSQGEFSFSISHARQLDALVAKTLSLSKEPHFRAAWMARTAANLEKLRRDHDRTKTAFGKDYTERALTDERTRKSIAKEAAMRQALRRQELEDMAWGQHNAVLSQPEELALLKNQLVHEAVADPTNPLRGRLMSRGAAIKAGKVDPSQHGDYDGADGVNPTVFGGQMMPDQIAQQLYDDHLIKEPTPDALWDALRREQAGVANMREYLKAARADVAQARVTARTEAKAWEAAEIKRQGLDHSLHAKIIRAFGMLDGILYALPPELRGKLGLHTATLAGLKSDEARLEYLDKTIGRASEEVEKWLVREYGKMWDALLEREEVKKNVAGKKPTGKAGADVHSLFATLRQAEHWTAAQADDHAEKLEGRIAKGTLSPEEEAHATLEAQLVRLIGGWHPVRQRITDPKTGKESLVVIEPGADAARRAAAVDNATRVFEAGYYRFRLEKLQQAEDRAIRREKLKADTGTGGTAAERDGKILADNNLKGGWKKVILSLGSFEQILHRVFGENSAEANRLADWERQGSHQATDGVFSVTDALDELFTRLAGGRYAGEKLRWKLAQKSLTIEGRQLCQLEAITATLMWRQEDGRRHMEGHKDGNGQPVGEWHYGQAFVDACEAALSPEAKEVRDHIADAYAGEWATLNPIFRRLNGIDLPRNANYSPLTVKPQMAQAGQTVDPVTGAAVSGASVTPGSLRTRGRDAIAEPDFRDALQTFIAHTKQMEHWKATAEFSAEAQALLNHRTTGNAMEAKGGAEAVKVLRLWLDNIALGGTRDAGAQIGLNQMLTRMSNRAAATALVGRAGVLAVQSVQLGAALAEMPAGAYLKRLGLLATGQLGWGDAMRSAYIQRRMQQLPPVVRQAMEGLQSAEPSRLKHAVARLGDLIGGADALFTAGTYAMVLDYQRTQAAKQGLAGQEAEDYARAAAERSVDRVAQPTRAGTRSLYENTATNPMVRVSWAFASEARQKMALPLFTLANPDASAGRKARAIAVTWIVGGMVATLVRTVWKDLRDDDDEWFDEKNWGAKRLALSTLTGPFQGIPGLGDILEAGAYKAAGQYLPEGNLFSSTGQAAGALTKIPDWFTGDREFGDALKDAEAMLSGMGVFNDTISAAASLSHLARDLYGVGTNAAN